MRNKVRELQRALYRAAKTDRGRCFHSLFDKVWRSDVLWEAWRRVKSNHGAPGNDRVRIEDIVAYGEVHYLRELQEELRVRRYRASSIRRVYLRKPGGGRRPLGIPCVRDRIVQRAVVIVLEPILEARFQDCTFGFRPRRSARDCSVRVRKYLNFGWDWAIDVDLRAYFDTIPQGRLLEELRRQVADQNIHKMVRAWLRAKVVDRGEVYKPSEGTPQGGVISPLLSNLYLDQFDQFWYRGAKGERGRYGTVVVRYADDILLLARQEDRRIWEEARGQLEGMGLSVNEEKTRFAHAKEGFDFLGYHFVRGWSWAKQKPATYIVPTHKARKRVWEKIRWHTDKRRYQNLPIEWVVKQINPILVGWTNYYRHTNSHRVFRLLQAYTNDRLRKALRYRSKKKGVGRYRDLPNGILYRRYGLACVGMGRIRYCTS